MPRALVAYVRLVDALNRRVGRIVMWMIFAMMGVLLWAAFSRTAMNAPLLWVVEFSQFMLVAYYLLGGPYAMQEGEHVRMDLFYASWSDRTKAAVDAFTVLFLLAYLVFLFYGGLSSTLYAIEYGERSYSVWRPYMWPIKTIACIGIFLMILQASAELVRDVSRLRGAPIA